MKDLEIKQLVLNLKIDNSSVTAWLTRTDARHWVPIRGANKQRIEKALDNIFEMCQSYNIQLSVELIPGENNPADALTRIPKYMLTAVDPPEFNVEKLNTIILTMIPEQNWDRDKYVPGEHNPADALTRIPKYMQTAVDRPQIRC
jgi:hypothetical protein